MSESPGTLSGGVLWGSRLAIVGVVLVALSVLVALLGINPVGPLYWTGILFAILGVSGAAIRGAQHSSVRYAGGLLSTMVGVLVIGYGVDDGGLLPLLVGVALLVVGAIEVIVDTRRIG